MQLLEIPIKDVCTWLFIIPSSDITFQNGKIIIGLIFFKQFQFSEYIR